MGGEGLDYRHIENESNFVDIRMPCPDRDQAQSHQDVCVALTAWGQGHWPVSP